MNRLLNKVILITGARKGIGRAREGAHVIVNYHSDRAGANTFAPGPVNIERNLQDDPDYRRLWDAMIPLARTAEPEEMIGPAVFLASAESSYVTGQTFFVDGGRTVQGKIPLSTMAKAAKKNRQLPPASE